ncbi:hypothetical protein DH2020_048942 [Rehmannia glutinosa]|uniref:Uncharacterized protein n=1 Tax=Rehmannia glutinosa TaxID=99300 RepID=A0ABR0U4D7_REHGL
MVIFQLGQAIGVKCSISTASVLLRVAKPRFGGANKIKIFAWRAFNYIIPCAVQLQNHKLQVSNWCQRCGMGPETIEHALRDCIVASEVWMGSALGIWFSSQRRGPFQDFCMEACLSLKLDNLEIFVMIIWAIWFARNKKVFSNHALKTKEVLDVAGRTMSSYQACWRGTEIIPTKHPVDRSKRWIPPKPGELKMNVDASFRADSNQVGIGCIVRDSTGCVIACCSNIVCGCSDPLTAEALAMREGLDFVNQLGLQIQEIETDSSSIADFCSKEVDLYGHEIGLLLQEIKNRLNSNMVCCFIPRECNRAAHFLAVSVFQRDPFFFGKDAIPVWIKPVVFADLIQ